MVSFTHKICWTKLCESFELICMTQPYSSRRRPPRIPAEPGYTIITVLGGAGTVARDLIRRGYSVTDGTVRHWMVARRPGRTGPTDGEIPQAARAAIIAMARDHGWILDYRDFAALPAGHPMTANVTALAVAVAGSGDRGAAPCDGGQRSTAPPRSDAGVPA